MAQRALLVEDDDAIAMVITRRAGGRRVRRSTRCDTMAGREPLLAEARLRRHADRRHAAGRRRYRDAWRACSEAYPDMPIIILSAQNTLDTAVRATRHAGHSNIFPSRSTSTNWCARRARRSDSRKTAGAGTDEPRRGPAADRAQPGDAGRLSHDHPRAAQRSDGADAGRKRHRQGTGRRGDPPTRPSQGRARSLRSTPPQSRAN